jgi:hypothetical protein
MYEEFTVIEAFKPLAEVVISAIIIHARDSS